MAFVVVLDANVLFGIEATDLLLTMARHRLFRVHWSPDILDEVRRNLDPPAPARLVQMDRAFPTASMDVPRELVEAMPVNDKDRHVLALAVLVGADSIVTENLVDFPPECCDPYDVEVIDTDTFVLAQVDLHPHGVLTSIDAMAARRTRHPRTRDDIIDDLARRLPRAMSTLRRWVGGEPPRSGRDLT